MHAYIILTISQDFVLIEVMVSLSSREYYGVEGQVTIIGVEATKATVIAYDVHIIIPENNITSESMNLMA